jgi:flagellar motor switch protein FliN/FliY
LDRNAIVPLDRRIDEPVILIAGDRIIAYGELQEMEDSETGALAVRITSIAEDDPNE